MNCRRSIVVALGALLALATPAFAQDEAKQEKASPRQEGMKIVRQAIQAAGGRKALEATNAATWNETGTYHGAGQPLPYTGKYAVQWPDKFRMEIEGFFTQVLNGDKGWMKTGDETRQMTDAEFKHSEASHYEGLVARLLVLRDRAYKVSVLDDATVDGRTCHVLQVKHEGRRDITLYFDDETSLLTKSETTAHLPEQDQEVKRETLFLDYQEIDGVKVPMRIVMTHDGKPFVEATMKDYKLHKALPDSTFTLE